MSQPSITFVSTDRRPGEAHMRRFLPFQTPVRGHGFAPRPRDARDPQAGQPAWLVRERTNPRDPMAVAVWVQDPVTRASWRIGYLERAVGARLAPRLDDGQRVAATVTGWWQAPGGWQRPVVRLVTVEPDGAAGAGTRDDVERVVHPRAAAALRGRDLRVA